MNFWGICLNIKLDTTLKSNEKTVCSDKEKEGILVTEMLSFRNNEFSLCSKLNHCKALILSKCYLPL